MKTQVIAAALILVAGTTMAQESSQGGFRGRNATNAQVRARQRVNTEDAALRFQRPDRRPVEASASEAPAPRGPRSRSGVRGEQPEVPAVREQPAPRQAPQGRRGPGAPQHEEMVRGERPQLPPLELQEFAPRRSENGGEAIEAPEAPAPRSVRRGPAGPQREEMVRGERPQLPPLELQEFAPRRSENGGEAIEAPEAPAPRSVRRGPAGPQREEMVRGERPQLPPVEVQEFAPRRPENGREELVTPEASVRARQGRRGIEGVVLPEVSVVEDPAALPTRRGPAGPQREGMIRGERPQQDVDYSADESEYESQADRAARASGRRAR